MHIALVSQEFPPGKHGGIGAQTKAKADGLSALGHSVTVITHSATDQLDETSSGRVKVIRIPAYDNRLAIYTEPVRWLTYSVQVAEILAKVHLQHAIDLIDFAEWGAEGYTFLLNRTKYNYIPAVVQLHGPLVMFAHTMDWPARDSEFYRIGTHMESTCVQLADAVYSSSQCSIDWCVRHYGLSSLDVPVLHTGVDTNSFRTDIASKEQRPTIVFVGKLVENKGVLELAAAAYELLDQIPELQVWMFGRGDTRVIEQLQAIQHKSSNPNFLQLRGFISREDLPEALARAHVFAAPSIYEGGPGFVYLEAMSCGLPVIACSGSGASEAVTPGETGFLVPPRDVAALTDVLRRLLTDASLRESIGRRARQWVLEQADSHTCIERLAKFYESVAFHGEPRRAETV